MHKAQDLIILFNQCFQSTYNTQLVLGDDEPIYLPANEEYSYNRIIFAHGFFSSALHECAHWLIAGEARRELIDFGYWYVPDGRTNAQQMEFQQVEVKPQAIELMLSQAAGFKFNFSTDNLNGEAYDAEPFKLAVREQVLLYEQTGLPTRAKIFHDALASFY